MSALRQFFAACMVSIPLCASGGACGSLVSGCLSTAIKQTAAEGAYTKALVDCSDDPKNTTSAAIDACQARVRQVWGVKLDGGSNG